MEVLCEAPGAMSIVGLGDPGVETPLVASVAMAVVPIKVLVLVPGTWHHYTYQMLSLEERPARSPG